MVGEVGYEREHRDKRDDRGFDSYEFERMTAVGAATNVNQIAFLSGCVGAYPNSTRKDVTDLALLSKHGVHQETGIDLRCYDANKGKPFSRYANSKMRADRTYTKKKVHPRTPWLFRMATDIGYVTWFGDEFCPNKESHSHWVTQHNFFSEHQFDFVFHHLYCVYQTIMKIHRHIQNIAKPDLVDSFSGKNRHTFPLQHITDLWEKYPDVPKFAFLNNPSAHTYNSDYTKFEQMDDLLVAFLEDFRSRQYLDNTIIVLRGDHGLQGGPTSVDYSVQIEQMAPWTEVLVPRKLLTGEEQAILTSNQDKLTTGFDLYATLSRLIQQRKGPADTTPPWAIDLTQQAIAPTRLCREARIPVDFCPCGNEYARERDDLTTPATFVRDSSSSGGSSSGGSGGGNDSGDSGDSEERKRMNAVLGAALRDRGSFFAPRIRGCNFCDEVFLFIPVEDMCGAKELL